MRATSPRRSSSATSTSAPRWNIGTALAEVGGSFDDVAKLTVYVVDWTPDKLPLFLAGVAKLGVTPVPPGTLLGVAVLDVPEHLVEVEATAVLD